MPLSFYFQHVGLTKEIYDSNIQKLTAAENGSPKGRLSHFALEDGDQINILDFWESVEDFEKFRPSLIAGLSEHGVEYTPPFVQAVYKSISL